MPFSSSFLAALHFRESLHFIYSSSPSILSYYVSAILNYKHIQDSQMQKAFLMKYRVLAVQNKPKYQK